MQASRSVRRLPSPPIDSVPIQAGEASALPGPLAGFKGPTSKGRKGTKGNEGKGREGRGREGQGSRGVRRIGLTGLKPPPPPPKSPEKNYLLI